MNYIVNEKIDKVKYWLLIAFVMVQPILDIYYLYTDKVVSFIGFSPSTIIRILITIILLGLTLIRLKDNRMWIIIKSYLSIVFIYTIMHILNARNFHSVVPGNFGYSNIQELFYIIRLIIPLCILFITYHLNVNSDEFNKVIRILLILIAGSIFITNLLNISLNSYTNEIIKSNIFGWFTGAYDKYNYSSLASKGFFNFANQIAVLLVLLLPIIMAIYNDSKKIEDLIIIIVTIISMIMLGTKVALYGAIIEVGLFVGLLIFMRVFKKEKTINKKNILLVILCLFTVGGLLSKAPALNRELVAKYVRINNSKVEIKGVNEKLELENGKVKNHDNTPPKKLNNHQLEDNKELENTDLNSLENKNTNKLTPSKSNKKEMMEYIENNYQALMVNEQFIKESYPYQYDPEFWVEIINLPVVERLNWRNIEQKMLQRVMDKNNNPMDRFFGLTFSRTQNIFNLERDFLSQYYSIGILGVIIFIGPYILLSILCLINILLKFKEKFNIMNSLPVFSILLALSLSYYSGNVIDSLTVMIILSFILGFLLSNSFKTWEV